MVEHVTVNHGVVGSSPTRGAKKVQQMLDFFVYIKSRTYVFHFCFLLCCFQPAFNQSESCPHLRLEFHNYGSKFSTNPKFHGFLFILKVMEPGLKQ